MERPFIYGKFVEGQNFTDRKSETKRLKLDFENGINVILMSRRRMGKTSLVKKAISEISKPDVKAVYMDIYDCRSEYDFYNRFASTLMKATASRMEQVMENVREFLVRVSPRLSFSPEPNSDFSLSLGITPQTYQPEEILNLPEIIAQRKGYHLVVCIDEFQQIGEFADTLTVQKRLRGVWQHQQNVSYCLFGSKKHLMTNLFLRKSMPFYMFGEMLSLNKIPTEEWVPFICSRFADEQKHISEEQAKWLCRQVDNYSSYVQQLAWIVMANTDKVVTDEILQSSLDELLYQCSELFIQQIQGLTTYQLNLLRAICSDIHCDFSQELVKERFPLGTKSNFVRLKTALIEKELIEDSKEGLVIPDPIFFMWLKRELLQ